MVAVLQPSFRVLLAVSVAFHLLFLVVSPSLKSLEEPLIRPIPLINLRLGGLEAGTGGMGVMPSESSAPESQPAAPQLPTPEPAAPEPVAPKSAPTGRELTDMLSRSGAAERAAAKAPPAAAALERRGAAGRSGAGGAAGGRVIGNPEGRGEEGITRYGQLLAVWIQRYKVYPKGRHNLGEAVVRVRIGRGGEVVAARIEESSGSRAVDDAALDMVYAASPVPPVPEWYEGEMFEFLLPVSFKKDGR